jgi:hypothetical protein
VIGIWSILYSKALFCMSKVIRNCMQIMLRWMILEKAEGMRGGETGQNCAHWQAY